MELVIIGPESSGNRWIAKVFNLHPEIKAHNTSYPRDNYNKRHYPNILQFIGFSPTDNDILLILCRDKTITKRSAIRTNHNMGHPNSAFTFEDTIQAIKSQIQEWPGKVMFFSYETLLVWREHYLNHYLKLFGLDTSVFPHTKVDYKDGNAKYLK